MADCRIARDIVAKRAFAHSAATERELLDAENHIAGCLACRDYLARFASAIQSSDQDELTCAEVRARWNPGAAKNGSAGDLAGVQRHLSRCPACTAEVAAWESILVLQGANALAVPPRFPAFDLSFLPQAQAPQLWTQVRTGLRRLVYEIPATLALAGQALFSPPPGLAVSYATVQAARRSRGRTKDSLVSLSVDDQPQDVRISLSVTAAERALWLAVSMHLLSSGQALSGERVALCNEQGQAQEIKTVRQGESEARFPDIAPGRYLVRVERLGKTWELPLAL